MTPRLLRPPPPQTAGFKTAVIAITLLGCAVFAVFAPPWARAPKPVAPARSTAAQYIEVDLRGPFFDQGRAAGWEAARGVQKKGFTRPAVHVLQFEAGERLKSTQAESPNDQIDFTDGYLTGFEQGWLAWKPSAK